jgi:hypothetical protein
MRKWLRPSLCARFWLVDANTLCFTVDEPILYGRAIGAAKARVSSIGTHAAKGQ